MGIVLIKRYGKNQLGNYNETNKVILLCLKKHIS